MHIFISVLGQWSKHSCRSPSHYVHNNCSFPLLPTHISLLHKSKTCLYSEAFPSDFESMVLASKSEQSHCKGSQVLSGPIMLTAKTLQAPLLIVPMGLTHFLQNHRKQNSKNCKPEHAEDPMPFKHPLAFTKLAGAALALHVLHKPNTYFSATPCICNTLLTNWHH